MLVGRNLALPCQSLRKHCILHYLAILYDMARTSIKATYSLDAETVRVLDQIAKRWGVSKSEAMRRAVLSAASMPAADRDARLAALDRAQQLFALTPAQADAWVKEVRAGRRAWKLPKP